MQTMPRVTDEQLQIHARRLAEVLNQLPVPRLDQDRPAPDRSRRKPGTQA